MNYNDGIEIVVADTSHEKYVDTILETITASAKKRGSGIATRTHEYLTTKMRERKAIIALSGPEKEFAGFCYIESWGNKEYVANSGLIVVEKFRNHHLATPVIHVTSYIIQIWSFYRARATYDVVVRRVHAVAARAVSS